MFDYDSLKNAVLELFLSVKIRSDEEIEAYSLEQFEREKRQMTDLDGFTLVDMIKETVEALMSMRIDEEVTTEIKAQQRF
jgi:ribosomal protein S10